MSRKRRAAVKKYGWCTNEAAHKSWKIPAQSGFQGLCKACAKTLKPELYAQKCPHVLGLGRVQASSDGWCTNTSAHKRKKVAAARDMGGLCVQCAKIQQPLRWLKQTSVRARLAAIDRQHRKILVRRFCWENGLYICMADHDQCSPTRKYAELESMKPPRWNEELFRLKDEFRMASTVRYHGTPAVDLSCHVIATLRGTSDCPFVLCARRNAESHAEHSEEPCRFSAISALHFTESDMLRCQIALSPENDVKLKAFLKAADRRSFLKKCGACKTFLALWCPVCTTDAQRLSGLCGMCYAAVDSDFEWDIAAPARDEDKHPWPTICPRRRELDNYMNLGALADEEDALAKLRKYDKNVSDVPSFPYPWKAPCSKACTQKGKCVCVHPSDLMPMPGKEKGPIRRRITSKKRLRDTHEEHHWHPNVPDIGVCRYLCERLAENSFIQGEGSEKSPPCYATLYPEGYFEGMEEMIATWKCGLDWCEPTKEELPKEAQYILHYTDAIHRDEWQNFSDGQVVFYRHRRHLAFQRRGLSRQQATLEVAAQDKITMSRQMQNAESIDLVLCLLSRASPTTWRKPTTLLRLIDVDGNEFVIVATGLAKRTVDILTPGTCYCFCVPGASLRPPAVHTTYGFEVLFELHFDYLPYKVLSRTAGPPFRVPLPDTAPSLTDIKKKAVGDTFDVLGYVTQMAEDDNAPLPHTKVTLQTDTGDLLVEVLDEKRFAMTNVQTGDLIMMMGCLMTEYRQRKIVRTQLAKIFYFVHFTHTFWERFAV